MRRDTLPLVPRVTMFAVVDFILDLLNIKKDERIEIWHSPYHVRLRRGRGLMSRSFV
jgi:hypothetical protein